MLPKRKPRNHQTSCEDCPFRGPKVGWRGTKDGRIVIIGESPGRQEVREGVPFFEKAPSGGMVWNCIPIDLHDKVFITNAMECSPPPMLKNLAKITTAAQCCHDRLIDQIKEYPRDIILALGNAAAWSLTGDYDIKITQARGTLLTSELSTHGILPIVHPAGLLHGAGTWRQFKADFDYGISLGRPKGKPRKHIKPKVVICDTPSKIKAAITYIKKATSRGKDAYIAGDVETTGLDKHNDELLSVGFCIDHRRVFIVPHARRLLRSLRPLFRIRHLRWIWHNRKFDIGFLRRQNMEARVDEDTMLLSYALDETRGVHDLETVTKDWIRAPDWKWMIKPYLPNKDSSYSLIPINVLMEYQAYDISYTLQVFKIMRKKVAADPHLEKLYTETLIPASEFLHHVEVAGMKTNWPQVYENKLRLEAKIEEAQIEVQGIAGWPFNPRSWQQVQKVLYEEQGFKQIKGHGKSTDAATLKLLPQKPFIKGMVKFRKVAKAKDTYITGKKQGMMNCTHEQDGKVHTTYLIHGTVTGRLSSNDPNVQNIPRDPLLRAMFMADDGCVFVEVDLNQAELRCLAELSRDERMMAHYNDPAAPSIHDVTATDFFGPDFDSEDKMKAKAVNFGIVYGREAPSLAEDFRMPIKEAQSYIDKWFESWPGAHKFIERCRMAPARRQTMITPFGRKKRHALVPLERLKQIQNEASNFPHQSIASDINLKAGIKARVYIQRLESEIVNLIHDSNLLGIPSDPELIFRCMIVMVNIMESIAPTVGLTRVPFIAECKIGHNWGNLKDIKFEVPRTKDLDVLEVISDLERPLEGKWAEYESEASPYIRSMLRVEPRSKAA